MQFPLSSRHVRATVVLACLAVFCEMPTTNAEAKNDPAVETTTTTTTSDAAADNNIREQQIRLRQEWEAYRRENEPAQAKTLHHPPRQQQQQDDDNSSSLNDAKIRHAAYLAQTGRDLDSSINIGSSSIRNHVGGMNSVLSAVKRRVWTLLAAPPALLQDLGIQPVRGLLLYGPPGCGKSLLATQLGKILSPLRPTTVVSGPEVLDKYVGSSERNLRHYFDNPSPLYDEIRQMEPDNGKMLSEVALHVIVFDEFDAISRTRGGGKEQSDARVARDSLVNQLLAKMDGVEPLQVPTLVVGLTNKKHLIDPALLRPGRFEVQLFVPPPRSVEERVEILRVHTQKMYQSGRLLCKDGKKKVADTVPTYEELLITLANKCDPNCTGAVLAGWVRTAASLAVERAVDTAADGIVRDCYVTLDDFMTALDDMETPTEEGNKEEL